MSLRSVLNKLNAFACLLVAVLLTGCFDTKQEFTINPDGSGKVVHESTFESMNLSMGGAQEDPQEALHDAIRKVLQDSKGVEAWRDVTFKRLDDERMLFRGTAYFKDLSKLDIPNQTMLAFAWRTEAGGRLVLNLSTNKGTPHEGLTIERKPAPAASSSTEDQAKKIKEARAKYQQAKPMLAAIVGGMKQEAVFHLPGKVSQSSNFQIQPSGALKVNFDGAKFLEAMDKLANDDAWMQKNAGAGLGDMNEKPVMDDEISGLLFEAKGPVQAVVSGPAAPLFDYAAEVAAARKDFAKTEKELGLTAASLAPPAKGEPLKNLRVAGVRLVTESDQKQDLRPFNEDVGYTIALRGEFSGSILAVTENTAVDTAIADDGSDLLPKSEWNRKIHFPHLSKDRTAVVLDVPLELPGKGVAGLKEVSGHLAYSVAGGTKEVDLGIDELKPGAKGTEFGARIESIKEGWQKDGSQEMELKLNLSADSVKSVTLVADGTKTILERNGSFGGGNTCTLTFSSKQVFPAKARLLAEVFDKVQTFEVSFKIENITLLGGPIPTK